MNGSWQDKLDRFIDERFSQIVDVRRHLHRNPEPSGDERGTSLYLYQRLGDEGFEVRVGPEGRGVLADRRAPDAAPSDCLIALRADIDALHIHDAKQVEYHSRREGIMHACGHDGHTALVFGALCALCDLQQSGDAPWPVSVRGIFQPSEETVTGAKEMIDVGALKGVDAILACHVDPSRGVGRIGVRSGVFTANCDQVNITIVGRGGHAARPHEASDPIAAAAQLINSLYLFIPRVTDSQDAVVITIGQLAGGDNANVIPEAVMLAGTVRTLEQSVREETFEHIRRLSLGIGQTTDTRIQVTFGQGCRSIRNHPALVDLLTRSSREILGEAGIEVIPRPSMGSEDFAFYLERVPGAMFRLGCTSNRAGGPALHSSLFDMDEESLRIGARILARAAVYRSDPDFRAEAK
jgi:amidohydrolase